MTAKLLVHIAFRLYCISSSSSSSSSSSHHVTRQQVCHKRVQCLSVNVDIVVGCMYDDTDLVVCLETVSRQITSSSSSHHHHHHARHVVQRTTAAAGQTQLGRQYVISWRCHAVNNSMNHNLKQYLQLDSLSNYNDVTRRAVGQWRHSDVYVMTHDESWRHVSCRATVVTAPAHTTKSVTTAIIPNNGVRR